MQTFVLFKLMPKKKKGLIKAEKISYSALSEVLVPTLKSELTLFQGASTLKPVSSIYSGVRTSVIRPM